MESPPLNCRAFASERQGMNRQEGGSWFPGSSGFPPAMSRRLSIVSAERWKSAPPGRPLERPARRQGWRPLREHGAFEDAAGQRAGGAGG